MFRLITSLAVVGGLACSSELPRDSLVGAKAEQQCQPTQAASSLSFQSDLLDERQTHGRFVSFLLQTDVDGDSLPDLIASVGEAPPHLVRPSPWETDSVEVWKGSPDGSFELLEKLQVPALANGVLVDANGDGLVDLIATTYDGGAWSLKILCGQLSPPFFVESGCGQGSYAAVSLPAGFHVRDLQVAPTSGEVLAALAGLYDDGKPEVLAVQWTSTDHAIRKLSSFLDEGEKNWAALEFVATALLDDDDNYDLVVTNGSASTLEGQLLPQVLLFSAAFDASATTLTRLYYDVASHEFAKYAQPRRPIIADLDRDGLQDITVINYGVNDEPTTGMPAIYYGTESGGWSFKAEPVRLGGEPIEGYVLDLDGNCLPDIVGMASDYKGIAPLLQTEERAFVNMEPSLSIQGAHRYWLVHGDYNGDGLVDLVTANAYGSPFEVSLPGRGYSPLVVHLQK